MVSTKEHMYTFNKYSKKSTLKIRIINLDTLH